MGYIDAREHSGGERHFDVDWSPIIEDLYSPELGNPSRCRGSACVEVMTTLHGSAPYLRRRAEGYVPLEGMIASARDLLKSTHIHLEPPSPCRAISLFRLRCFLRIDLFFHLDIPSWDRVEERLSGSDCSQPGYTFWVRVERLVRYSERQSMDQQVVTVDQFTGRHGFYPGGSG
ncbi:hypothetical protein CK203_051823 [Vitis vinifera]|uniref:Uncharacterized protein n=1 Tax=Vitis vinifera TaxID=29760 RepID=A0A438GUP6_VITVI|nr:hypothetical protein CK203_051823 [Vitis vinifera]